MAGVGGHSLSSPEPILYELLALGTKFRWLFGLCWLNEPFWWENRYLKAPETHYFLASDLIFSIVMTLGWPRTTPGELRMTPGWLRMTPGWPRSTPWWLRNKNNIYNFYFLTSDEKMNWKWQERGSLPVFPSTHSVRTVCSMNKI